MRQTPTEPDPTDNMQLNALDRYAGKKLKQARHARGMSQAALATGMETSPQQIQKYESGQNRICASRIFRAAHTLSVPVSFFFPALAKTNWPPECTDELEILTAYRHLRSEDKISIKAVISALPKEQTKVNPL